MGRQLKERGSQKTCLYIKVLNTAKDGIKTHRLGV